MGGGNIKEDDKHCPQEYLFYFIILTIRVYLHSFFLHCFTNEK